MFVPIASLAALALAARPDWLLRFGLALGVLSVLTTAATILTVGAGQAFRADREAELGPAPIGGRLDQHAEAGERLRLVMLGFTLVLLLAVYVARTRRADGAAALVLRGLLAVLAVLALSSSSGPVISAPSSRGASPPEPQVSRRRRAASAWRSASRLRRST